VNDSELARLRRARAFDRAALAAIYDDYHQAIYRYIYRQVGEVETARDLTADVFQRLLQAFQQGKGPEQNVRAWLYRTAHNGVVDHYRRQKYRQHLPLQEDLINVSDDPVAQAEGHISAAEVRSALQHLTPDQRQVLVLKFLEEFSNQEIAVVLNKPVGAVKSLQHRALAALQRHLTSVKEKMLL
jgi:RNA polymerase sigma-70 factor (ECF subfamily)